METANNSGGVQAGAGGTAALNNPASESDASVGLSPPDVGGPAACAVARAEAELVRQPVDIIMVLDNSGSMNDEVRSVEQNINANFAEILRQSGVDYRVILISEHRTSNISSTTVCIERPLSGLASCPADEPVFSDRFFHYSAEIGSEDSLEVLLDSYEPPFIDNDHEDEFGNAPNGWSEWLRPDAKKVFLEFTDDESELQAISFLQELTRIGPENFGSGLNDLTFVWHSITGIAEKANPTEPYEPDEPIEEKECRGNNNNVQNAGETYQELSQLTGGLRFPLCQFNAYDAVFQTIAQDVVLTGELQCDFAVPEPPQDQEVVLDNVAVSYAPGNGTDQVLFDQVLDVSACDANAFYVGGDRLVLCPQSCQRIREDAAAALEVVFTCESTIVLR